MKLEGSRGIVGTVPATTDDAAILLPAAIGLYTVLASTLPFTDFIGADEDRYVQLVLLLGVPLLIGVVRPLRERTAALVVGSPRATALTLAVIAWAALSGSQALLPGHAMLDLSVHVLLVLLVLGVAAAVSIAPRRASLALVVALAGAITLYSLHYLTLPRLVPRGVGLWTRGRWGGFPNPRYLGQLYALTVPVTVWAAFHPRLGRGPRTALVMVAAGGWWATVLMAERGAPLAMFVGPIVAVALWFRTSDTARLYLRRLVLVGIAGLGAGIATRMYLVGGTTDLGVLLDKQVSSSSGRLALWEHTAQLIVDHPVLGVGPGHLAHVVYLQSPSAPTSPHNSILRVTAEWGVPAAVLLAGIAVAAGLAMRRGDRFTGLERSPIEHDPALSAAVVASLMTAAALSLVSGVAATPIGQTLLATLVGWTIGLYWRPRDGPAATGVRVTTLATTAIVAVVGAMVPVAATVATTTPSSLRTREQLYAGEENIQSLAVAPRFWTHGVIGFGDGVATEGVDDVVDDGSGG